MKKHIIITTLGSFLTIFFLILYLTTVDYNKEWGEFSANETYVINLVIGITILITGIYSIYKTKNNQSTYNTYLFGFGVVSLILAFIPLGNMFEQIANKESIYLILENLIMSIVGFFVLIYIVISYLDNKKRK